MLDRGDGSILTGGWKEGTMTVFLIIIAFNHIYERPIAGSFWHGAPMNDLEYCEKLASQYNRMTRNDRGIAYCIEAK
jgi:hypothetical protein